METKEKEQETVAAPPERAFVKFPEDQIKGDGFTQLDVNTGWLWIGINLNKFSFRDAWAFIKSQEFNVSQYMSQRESAAMLRAQLTAKGGKTALNVGSIMSKLGLKG